MKKVLLLLFTFLFFVSGAFSAEDYNAMYENAGLFGSRLYNDIDPYEDEDNIKYAYSPYPLFRIAADLYFKEYMISSGYYSLAPRTLKGRDYVLFKQGGKVKFIIPAVKKEMTPPDFYSADIPRRKKSLWQKFTEGCSNTFYRIFRSSQKIPPPKSYISAETYENFLIICVYYGKEKYTLLFKRMPD